MNPRHSRYNYDADLDTLSLPQRTQQFLSVRIGGDGSLFRTMRQKIGDLNSQVVSQFIMAGCGQKMAFGGRKAQAPLFEVFHIEYKIMPTP